MRLLAVNQFYAPDHAATSQLLTELCEDLAAAGDEVTVIAGRGRYSGGDRLAAMEVLRGVRVVRPWATGFGKRRLAGRLADYLSFWAAAVARAAVEARPDVILAVTTPPMIAAGALLVARARGIPLVTWVQDVYPDVAVAFGVLSARGPAARALSALQTATYRGARRTVAISRGMAARLEAQGAPSGRLRVVANWADGSALRPLPHEANPFRRAHGLEGRFVAMYSGNLGVGHDLSTLVGAARRLEKSAPRVLFLFVGDGARRAEAEALAAGLGNVRFLPYQPHADLAFSLAAADLHLISLREGLEGLIVPSKLYGVLAVGRPAMYVGPEACEVARVIREGQVGWEGRPGDVEGLGRAIEAAAASPAWCAERGARARALFEAELDRPIAIGRWRAVLEEARLAGGGRRAPRDVVVAGRSARP